MKLVVTASGPTLDAAVDPRFGRCPYFLVVETDDLTFEAVENPNATADAGAGIRSAQMMAEKGAKALLTGNCGPNAFRTLSAAGIQVVVGCSGTVRQTVEAFALGQLGSTAEPNVAAHFGSSDPATGAQSPPSQAAGQGMGPGMETTRGRGMGRGGGMGRGWGKGMGRGRRRGGNG